MSDERHLVRSAVYVLLEKDNEILLIRRHNTGYRDGEYTVPAGHVEPNETLLQTGVREANEEICVTIKPEDLHLVHVMQRHEKDVDIVDYYFSVRTWEGEPRIGEPHKSDDCRWVPRNEIKNHAIHFVDRAIAHAFDGILYSHDGIET